MNSIPPSLNWTFIGLVTCLYFTVIYGVYYGWKRQRFHSTSPKRVVFMVALCLGIWLTLTGILAAEGFFSNFEAVPPRFLFIVLPAIAATLYLAFFEGTGRLVNEIPGRLLVGVQSFRILVEIILWLLFMHHAMPELMTFTGRNFDIVIALTAPTIAFAAFRGPEVNKKMVIIWNCVGLIALINVVIHGLLSAPTPFRVFFTDPPNTAVGYFPFIWLPAFVVPVAFFFHLVSIRKTL